MSLEAMETLTSVEDRLRKQKADAAAAVKQAAVDARAQGEAIIAEARQKAQEEIAGLTRETDEKAKALARELAEANDRDRAALQAKAKTKEEEAVSFVVERIVNG